MKKVRNLAIASLLLVLLSGCSNKQINQPNKGSNSDLDLSALSICKSESDKKNPNKEVLLNSCLKIANYYDRGNDIGSTSYYNLLSSKYELNFKYDSTNFHNSHPENLAHSFVLNNQLEKAKEYYTKRISLGFDTPLSSDFEKMENIYPEKKSQIDAGKEIYNNLLNQKKQKNIQTNEIKEEGYFKEGTNVLNLIKNDIVTDQNGCKLINPNPSQNGKESITWTGSCRDGFLNGYGIMTWYLNGKKNENEKLKGVFNGILMEEKDLYSADYGLYILSSIRKNINVKNTNYKKFILNETIGLSAVIDNVWEGTANYYIDNKPYAKRISSGKSRINKAWSEITEGYLSIGTYDYPGKYIFFDGTEIAEGILKFEITHKGQNYIAYEKEKENFLNNKQAIEEKQRNIEVTAFRKNLKEGNETSIGLVVQIKGDLIKVQTNDSQCSQRDYNGSCRTWINTPVEKWVKRSEIYPR